jgi:hypothetical protein
MDGPHTFASDTRGSMALWGAGLLIVAILVVTGIVDVGSLMAQNKDVQAAADAAAIGAAREMQLAQDPDRLDAVAEALARANLSGYANVTAAVVTPRPNEIEVSVSSDPRVYFAGPVGANAKRVTRTAVAQFHGAPVCMIGLDPKAKKTLQMRKKAAITAENCAIYSNSTAKDGVTIEGEAQIEASFICSAGGVKTDKKFALDPAPLTDCPPLSDPLLNRPPPPVGSCDFTKLKIDSARSLGPGVYCGGLEIKAAVTLSPGIYVIKDGSLKVDKGSLTGEGVGFFLTGKDALINFEKSSVISLRAPKTGPLAGLLFYEDRKVVAADGGEPEEGPPPPEAPPKEHRIRSDDAGELVGTIYIPRNRLLIDGDKPVADQSEYTVIIAREFALSEGPAIVLNTDYASSDVPVPQGVGPNASKRARLVR